MGPLVGGDMRSTPSSSLCNLTQTVHSNGERMCSLELVQSKGAVNAHANNGELPLFFPTVLNSHQIASSSHLSSNAGHESSGLYAGTGFRHEDAGWPLASQEIASWASSFRFELDAPKGDTLQSIVENGAPSSAEATTGKTSDNEYVDESPAGSFRFRNGLEDLNGKQFGYLKPPRQLEIFRSSRDFSGVSAAVMDEENRKDVHPKDCQSIMQMGKCNNRALDVQISPGRGAVLRRLSDLKAHGSRTGPEVVTEDKEKDQMAMRKDDVHQRLRSSVSSLNEAVTRSSTQVSREYVGSSRPKSRLQEDALGELDIMPIAGEGRQQATTPPRLGDNPCRSGATPQGQPTTPSNTRFGEKRGGRSIHEQIVNIRKESVALASNASSSPSPDHPLFPAAVPFQWEEEPGKPKTIAAATQRALARQLSRKGIELGSFVKSQSSSQTAEGTDFMKLNRSANSEDEKDQATSMRSSPENDDCAAARSESCRYYGKGFFKGHSREASWGRSSRRYSIREKETQIDLVASAAAKFLVEGNSAYESPMGTPGRPSSSPTFSVPFKWEDAPGKAKVETATRKPNILRLPPRLAIPSHRSSESLSRELRVSYPSHSFAGFFSPCMTASSPVRKQNDRIALVQYDKCKSLPPRVPSPPERRKRYGFVGQCISTPREGCQIRKSRSFEKASNHSSRLNKAFSGPLPTTNSPVLKPRNLFSGELKSSSPWMQKGNLNAPTSPTSILCGPDEGSSQTSTSNMFSSGDLEAFTQQTPHSGIAASKSSSSSSASYDSIEGDFAQSLRSAYSLPPLISEHQHTKELEGIDPCRTAIAIAMDAFGKEQCAQKTKGPPEGVKSLLKICKTSSCLGKTRSQQRPRTKCSPEVWASALATSLQSLELKDAATSTALLDEHGVPTSSGYLNCKGEPIALKDLPRIEAEKKRETLNSQASPERPTRLPYTMPSVAEKLHAASDTCTTPIQGASPRLPRINPGHRFTPNRSGGNTPARVERYLKSASQASHGEEQCQSPAYAAALELLSPAVNLVAQRRMGLGTPKIPISKPPLPKIRRRARFLLSICRTFKRVFFRPPRRKVSEPKLTYRDGLAPTTFQFSKPN